MKTKRTSRGTCIALAFAFSLGVRLCFGQAEVDFFNDTTHLSSPPDRLIRFHDPCTNNDANVFGTNNAPAVGTNFMVQLYYGAVGTAENNLNPVTEAPARLRPSTTSFLGIWQGGGRRTLPGFPYGSGDVLLQVRVWDINFGATYEQAYVNGRGSRGKSAVFVYTTPANASSPAMDFAMKNFQGFGLVDTTFGSVPSLRPEFQGGDQSSFPRHRTNYVGQSTTFEVYVNGFKPMWLQWRHEGTNVGAAKFDCTGLHSYTIADTQPSNAGNYELVATNEFGSNTFLVYIETVAALLTTTTVGPGTVAPASGPQAPGSTVTVTATPNAGAAFAGWSGDAFGIQNPLPLVMSTNKTLTALFTNLSGGATQTVSSLGDSGAGSLRNAIANAANGDNINFTARGTITLTSGELLINKTLNIVGPGAASLTVSGNNSSRVFNIAAGASVNISGLTIRDGRAGRGSDGAVGMPGTDGQDGAPARCCNDPGGDGAPGGGSFGGKGSPGEDGGAIYNAGYLALTACAITGTAGAGGNGGLSAKAGNGGAGGQGIRCYNTNGTSGGHGGLGGESHGGDGGSGGRGGAIYNAGDLVLTACSIRGNAGTGGVGGAANTGGSGGVGGVGLRGEYHFAAGGPGGGGGDGGNSNGGMGGSGGSGGGIYNAHVLVLTACPVSGDAGAGGMGGGCNNAGHGGIGGDGGDSGANYYEGGLGPSGGDGGVGGTGGTARGGSGGNGGDGAGIHNAGSLMMTDCTIFGNCGRGGDGELGVGGIGGNGGKGGDARIYYTGEGCSGNGGNGGDAGRGGDSFGGYGGHGGSAGGIYNADGSTVALMTCTVSASRGSGGAGGAAGPSSPGTPGAGGMPAAPTNTMCPSAVAGASGTAAGPGTSTPRQTGPSGIAGGISGEFSQEVTLEGCTIAGNRGLGIFAAALTVHNTIIALNTEGEGLPNDVSVSSLRSYGHNLVGIVEGSSGWVSSDLVGSRAAPLDPRLGPLQDNGGPTLTMALLPGSPAIDAGHSGGTVTDQRGAPRPNDNSVVLNAAGGDGSDIGAFEVAPSLAITTTGQGSVSKSPEQPFYAYNASVALNANASVGWVFDHWSGDASGTNNPLNITMSADKSITANFHPYVTADADSGVGSLRQAIANVAASAVKLITFEPAVSFIELSSGLAIDHDLSIIGPGADSLFIDGGGANFVFGISASTVNLSGMSIVNGTTGIILIGASVNVSNCVISGHSASGIYNSTNGTVVLNGCTISGNRVSGSSGFIRGAGVNNLTSSSVLIMTNCTVSGNTVTAIGTGRSQGAGINNQGTATLIGCTICSNKVSASSGVAFSGGIYSGNSISLTVGNTIVAGNVGNFYTTSGSDDCTHFAVDLGYNLIGATNDAAGWAASDQTGGAASPLDPKLGPLQSNGGGTPTHALLAGSPATDQGKAFGVATDQRGQRRFDDDPAIPDAAGGDASDIGAYEGQLACPGTLKLRVAAVGSGTVGKNPNQSCFATNSVLTLTATPAIGWTFTGWSDDASSTQNPLRVTMSRDKFITANFAPCAPLGLVAWWPGGSNANDIVGANNGNLVNGATYSPGEAGAAFSFDGADDYVDFGTAVGNFGTGDFTAEFWIKTTSARIEYLLGKRPGCGHASFWDIRLDPTGVLEAEVDQELNGVNYLGVISAHAVNNGAFHHVAMVRQGTNLSIYIDGVFDAGGTGPGVAAISNSGSVTAGRTGCSGFNASLHYFTGLLDEISLYNRALSAAEIQAIYNAGSAGKCLSPVYITSVSRVGTTVYLSWLAQKGLTYRVQSKATLSDATWTDASGDVAATGNSTSTSITDPAQQRFYRVVMFR